MAEKAVQILNFRIFQSLLESTIGQAILKCAVRKDISPPIHYLTRDRHTRLPHEIAHVIQPLRPEIQRVATGRPALTPSGTYAQMRRPESN